MKFNKIAIIGVGFMGGSIALDIRRLKLAKHVVGYFRTNKKMRQALSNKIIDSATTDFSEAIKNCDLIILCTPIRDILKKLKKLKRSMHSTCLITDIGSTKKKIAESAKLKNFIGSHPLAGSEQSGFQHAQKGLFKNSVCILTPTKSRDPKQLKRLKSFWRSLGTKVTIMTPLQHDTILSYTSHLPHAIGYALMEAVSKKMCTFSAGSLKDTTRIVLSKPEIWVDIFLSNRKAVCAAIRDFTARLNTIQTCIKNQDSKKLLSIIRRTQQKRAGSLPK